MRAGILTAALTFAAAGAVLPARSDREPVTPARRSAHHDAHRSGRPVGDGVQLGHRAGA